MNTSSQRILKQKVQYLQFCSLKHDIEIEVLFPFHSLLDDFLNFCGKVIKSKLLNMQSFQNW